MPRIVRIRVSNDGVDMNYDGFWDKSCHTQHTRLLARLKSMGIKLSDTMSTDKQAPPLLKEKARELA